MGCSAFSACPALSPRRAAQPSALGAFGFLHHRSPAPRRFHPTPLSIQVGPCTGIAMGDDLWMSRYIMYRLAELYNVECTFDPKPIPGDWNGAGGHCNFSSNVRLVWAGVGMPVQCAAVHRLAQPSQRRRRQLSPWQAYQPAAQTAALPPTPHALLQATRKAETGWQAIQDQIANLEKRHAVHIAAYGEGNERRLTGA